MKKLLLFCFMLFILPINILASDLSQAKIGNRYFDSLEDAINAASSADIINLINNVSLSEPLNINKTVNINLNGNSIQAKEKVFTVHGGSLNLSGVGLIRETKPNYGAIVIQGSDDPNKKDFSTINIGKDVKLEGWSGIFINHYNNKGYGILVNMNGSINAVDDVNGGTGIGIYVNGNIQHENNSPIINLSDTTKITSTGNGIYAAGYATYNINGAYIEGKESGLGIKAGKFNILDGAILGTGDDKTPTAGNNNGINPAGVAIQIESNQKYAGNIELFIKNGTIKSINSYVVYEYTASNNPTEVKKINISGGNFYSDAGKNVFLLSESLKTTHPKFISGGTYTSDPKIYLENGYSAEKNKNSQYEVSKTTAAVFNSNIYNNNSFSLVLPIIGFIILNIIIYLKRNDFINLINK